MPELKNIEQGSEEWFKARLGKATASRFSDVMAMIKSGEAAGRRNYRAELVRERLSGQKTDSYTSSAMQWGIDTEAMARNRYMWTTGNIVDQCGFYVHDTLEAGASPDGLIGTDGTLEIKCPQPATHAETLHSRKVPKVYIPQVQGQLWITGRLWADFVSYDPYLPPNAAMIIIRVERDDEYIGNLEVEVASFLKSVEEEVKFIREYKV